MSTAKAEPGEGASDPVCCPRLSPSSGSPPMRLATFSRQGRRKSQSVAGMKRSEMRDLPAPETKTRIALRSIRATLATLAVGY